MLKGRSVEQRGSVEIISDPTPRQMEVLVAIVEYRELRGYSPSMQELADKLTVSKVTIWEHIEALRTKGLITESPGTSMHRNAVPTIAGHERVCRLQSASSP